MDNKKHETRHIVAILDMLGASNMIRSDSSEKVMNFILTTYDDAENKWPFLEHAPKMIHNLKCITFSDNILFALEIEGMDEMEVEEAIKALTVYIAVFQRAVLKYVLLFRGGMTIGKLYMNEAQNFVWGEALVNAHELEAKEAKYPRVILSDEFDQELLSKCSRVKKDDDGKYFVDYFWNAEELADKWIVNYDEMIKDAYIKYKDEKGILSKYVWLNKHIRGQQGSDIDLIE